MSCWIRKSASSENNGFVESRMKVAVLMGGPSEEHDISLKSGRGVVDALLRRRWAVVPVVIPKPLTIQEACAFVERTLREIDAELAFIALHGTFGEDGMIQQVCETLHIPYTGSDPQASRLGMDKVASRRRFQDAGLVVPRWRVLETGSVSTGISDALPSGWSYPVVVKPINQGSSLGVSIVRRDEDLRPAWREAARFGSHALMEEFVAGRELTVGVLGETPLPVVEIRPHQPFFNFTAKYTSGETDYVVPAVLPPATAQRVQSSALTAHRALGCRHLSRTDLILNRHGVPVILEVNTIPGFTPTSLLPKAAACLSISYDELCEQIILMAAQSLTPVASREPGSDPQAQLSRLGSDPGSDPDMSAWHGDADGSLA